MTSDVLPPSVVHTAPRAAFSTPGARAFACCRKEGQGEFRRECVHMILAFRIFVMIFVLSYARVYEYTMTIDSRYVVVIDRLYIVCRLYPRTSNIAARS